MRKVAGGQIAGEFTEAARRLAGHTLDRIRDPRDLAGGAGNENHGYSAEPI